MKASLSYIMVIRGESVMYVSMRHMIHESHWGGGSNVDQSFLHSCHFR